MIAYTRNELKNGMRVLLDREPYLILENEHTNPGKGQAFNRIKLRHLKTHRVIERTLKSNDALEEADVLEIEVTYLYRDGDAFYFMDMDPNRYEQYSVTAATLTEAQHWLKLQAQYTLILFNGEPLQLVVPNSIILKVQDTDPGVRGDTSGGGSKSATLETGVVIRVPLFIEADDRVKVDTRTVTYLERIKA